MNAFFKKIKLLNLHLSVTKFIMVIEKTFYKKKMAQNFIYYIKMHLSVFQRLIIIIKLKMFFLPKEESLLLLIDLKIKCIF